MKRYAYPVVIEPLEEGGTWPVALPYRDVMWRAKLGERP